MAGGRMLPVCGDVRDNKRRLGSSNHRHSETPPPPSHTPHIGNKCLFGGGGENKEPSGIGHLPWWCQACPSWSTRELIPPKQLKLPITIVTINCSFFLLLLLFSFESLGLSSLRCLGELISLRFQRCYKIEEELRVVLHPGGDAATQSEFYHKTGENKDANLVISRRPSCFGSDEERAVGKGMLRMRRLVGPPNAAYGSPDVTEKEKRFL